MFSDVTDSELFFLASLCKNDNVIEDLKLPTGITPEVLFELAVAHGVALIISAKHFPSKYQSDGFKAFLSSLSDYARHKRIAQTFIDSETNKALSFLNFKNIRFVILKGFALSRTVYNNRVDRIRADVDILVDESHYSSTKAVLSTLGYYNPRGWEPKLVINQFTMRRKLSNDLHLDFDIHLKISNNKSLDEILKLPEISKEAVFDQSCGSLLIGNVHALFHSLFHMMNHMSEGDQVKLVWLYDIHLLVLKLSLQDTERFLTLVNNAKIGAVVVAGLEMCHKYFKNIKLDSLITHAQKCNSSEKYAHLLQVNRRFNIFFRDLLAIQGIYKKILFLCETIFPSRHEIYNKYGDINKRYLLVFYIARIVKGVLKYVRR